MTYYIYQCPNYIASINLLFVIKKLLKLPLALWGPLKEVSLFVGQHQCARTNRANRDERELQYYSGFSSH